MTFKTSLKLIFQANARIERYEVSNKFYSCKMEENSSVSEHILRMSGYHNHLTQLGVNLPDDSVIDRVVQSLPLALRRARELSYPSLAYYSSSRSSCSSVEATEGFCQ